MVYTYVDEKGYKRFSDSGKLVSRWVAKKKLGRPLKRSEKVHHVDRDKLNNSRNNLWVFPNQRTHDRIHRQDSR